MITETKEIQVGELLFEPYLSEAAIKTRVSELAAKLSTDFKDKNPLYLVVLSGAFVFAADLVRDLAHNAETCFVRLKSYEGTQSTDQIQEVFGLDRSIAGRSIVVVEDIIDTGNTLKRFIPQLVALGPKDIALVTLLYKKEAFKADFGIDYVGFEVPDKFVIGYGLDYNEGGRNLRSIYQLKK